MPRNMSFALTTEQIKSKSKTVTRRFGWWFLSPGDRVWAVEKAMGLRKGESVKRLCLIEIVSTRAEKLADITPEDCVKEGFPEFSPNDFVEMLKSHFGLKDLEKPVNRIEFRYCDPSTVDTPP